MAHSSAAARAAQGLIPSPAALSTSLLSPSTLVASLAVSVFRVAHSPPSILSPGAQRRSDYREDLPALRSSLLHVATSARSTGASSCPSRVSTISATCPAPSVTASPSSFAASGFADALPATWQPRRGYSVETSSVVVPGGGAQLVRLDHLTGDDEGIAVLTLNRPVARNAISKQLLADLMNAMAQVKGGGGTWGMEGAGGMAGAGKGAEAGRAEGAQEQATAAVRVVIIRSAVDGVFCAGADLKERKGMTQEEAEEFVSSLRGAFTDLEDLPVPTVAAVEGAALGGGLEMLLACDIRVAGFNARFGLPETSLAIIPGAGGTQRLPRLIGASRAKELIFTARIVRADEALSLGIVSHCVPAGTAYDTALEIARTILCNGPLAVQLAKEAINKGRDVDMKGGLQVEEKCYQGVLRSRDRLEGLAAFAGKRKPVYHGV
ncbi:unnamed protein product [Closterium sp. Yama58-4]|nr:unnamed protein product [Closterium sp. Yama58-4]